MKPAQLKVKQSEVISIKESADFLFAALQPKPDASSELAMCSILKPQQPRLSQSTAALPILYNWLLSFIIRSTVLANLLLCTRTDSLSQNSTQPPLSKPDCR